MNGEPGQLLFVGFPGSTIPDELAALVAVGRIGGVVLFARNVEDPKQLRALVRSLHATAPEHTPLLVSIDQEGGRVQRLRAPWTLWPPLRAVGDLDDPDTTRAFASALACELLDLGIGLDFAPVVDVATEPTNPVIGDRSFGESSACVSRHGAVFIEAMQRAGVAACAKHFPGHGDTTVDSHHALPVLSHGLDRLPAVELPPFRAAIAAGVASVMTSHVLFPELDPDRPATLSPTVLAILREELGYDGVVFSDDLEMHAVADAYPVEQRVRGALEAGVDALLVCSDPVQWREALRVLEAMPATRLEVSLRRMQGLKARFAGTARACALEAEGGGPPYETHLALAARLSGRVPG